MSDLADIIAEIRRRRAQRQAREAAGLVAAAQPKPKRQYNWRKRKNGF